MSKRSRRKKLMQRQGVYERRYARLFLAVLAKQYKQAAESYPSPYTPDPDDYRSLLEKLYTEVLPREAEQAWNDYVKPLGNDQKSGGLKKDFFDTLMGFLGMDAGPGEWIRIWRDTAREWLNLNILSKINGIATTTQRAIAKVVEDQLNAEVTSIDTVQRAIQEAANGEVNKQRATLIARTEVMQALNKGRRLSMYSSGLEWSKEWIDTPDSRTRLSHSLIAREAPRSLDDPYWLVDKNGMLEPADHPGDPQLSAENVINCRCTETYEVVRDAAGRPVRRNETAPIRSADLAEII